ncbi:MAG: aspartate carbamoyltransferase catalytic subunit [Deltaproteobacteria bacterium]|nr:aspartate carbamoyltransferase catalytic subunit [Deltaproteobacteria bacterium]
MGSLVGLRGLPADRITALLDRAAGFRSQVAAGEKRLGVLAGRSVALLFLEPSTRTRFSFEMAAHRLGAQVLAFSAASSSATKGETLADTTRVLASIGADAVVLRHTAVGAPHRLDKVLPIPVINAGDGINEHPTQGLLDLLTLRDHLGPLAGKTVAIVGDLRHSRVARSNCFGLRTLGADVLLVGPGTLCPPELDGLGGQRCRTLDEVLERADAIMMLRIQRERAGPGSLPSDAEYRRFWGLTAVRAARMKAGALVMHPAPMNRGVEIDDEVADGPSSVIFEQMADGVFVRMAALAEAVP